MACLGLLRPREGVLVPFIITDPCIDTKDQACVSVCPVDCIHFEDADRMLYINPTECIDCGACQPACPVSAIFPEDAVPDASKKFISINELWYTDKAAARAQVGGGSGAAAPAAGADAGHSPAAAPAAAAPAAKAAAKVDETPPILQVPATKGVHAPSISAYTLPPASGFISLAIFAVTFALMFIQPGPALLVIGGAVPIGATVMLLLPVSLVFLLIFLRTQTRDLSFFAARQRRQTGKWRGVNLEWRRNEESRRYNLAETVNAIARERFAFPNVENPDLCTYVNLPEPTMALEPRGTGEKVFPDIVAVSYPGNYPVAVAQVESKETVTLDQARYVWSKLQNKDAELYLYVPTGSLARAKDYAKVAGMKNVKFRTWRWTPNGMVVREL